MSALTAGQTYALQQLVETTSMADVIRALADIDDSHWLWVDEDKARTRRAKRLNAFASSLDAGPRP